MPQLYRTQIDDDQNSLVIRDNLNLYFACLFLVGVTGMELKEGEEKTVDELLLCIEGCQLYWSIIGTSLFV